MSSNPHPETPREADSFVLGASCPDWWMDLLSVHLVITHNNDGRWRGGPDCAVIWTPTKLLYAQFGDTIQRVDGTLSVVSQTIPAAPSSVSTSPEEKKA